MSDRHRSRAVRVRAVGLACLAATAFALAASAPVAIGERLPDVQLTGLNGASRHLAEFRGKPLVINVWASWCGPCQAETASLERLAWRTDAGTFAIIGISTDDDPAQALAWLARSHATISHFIDHDLTMEHLLGASRIPVTVLVGADGRVLERIQGAREWDSADSRALLRAAWARAADQGSPGRN